jgi:hypothetical protein
MRALIVFPQQQVAVAAEIRTQIREGAKARGSKLRGVDIEYDVESAIETAKREDFTHLIVHERIAPTPNATPAMGHGICLAETLKAQNSELKILLMPARANTRWSLMDAQKIGALGIGIASPRIDAIPELVTRVLDDERPTSVVNIVIDLSQEGRGCEYVITREGGSYRQGVLSFRPYELQNLSDLSKELDECNDWKQPLKKLRGQLYDSIIHSALSDVLNEFIHSDDQEHEARVCFKLNEANSNVAFEAIRHPRSEDYWMLYAPIVRSFHSSVPAEPVEQRFNGRRNFFDRCLVVLSDASGTCTFRDQQGNSLGEGTYSPLPGAEKEFTAIVELLEKEKGNSKRVGHVEPVRLAGNLTPDRFSKLLEQEWDLIHYIGHTEFVFDEGHFILPGNAAGEAVALGVSKVATKLRKTPFVYLSSCYGSRAPFVRRLAEQRVPCTLGFRNSVPDAFALEHATCFYGRLFKLASIEHAFLQTRQQFKEMPERFWACSSLVVQMH